MKQTESLRTFEIIVVALVVLFIIALTASLIFHKPPPANNPKVKSAIMAISAAIRNYDSVYGSPPCEPNTIARFGETNAEAYDKMMEFLTEGDGPDKDTETMTNSKQINFLYTLDGYKTDGWVDEWKSRYNIIMNSTSQKSFKIGKRAVPGKIFVYSSGKNRHDENGEGDDIADWK